MNYQKLHLLKSKEFSLDSNASVYFIFFQGLPQAVQNCAVGVYSPLATVHPPLVYSKHYFTLAGIFVLRLFKMSANQSAPGLNRGISSNFWLLESANNVKFTEEFVMCTEKYVFVKKSLQMG